MGLSVNDQISVWPEEAAQAMKVLGHVMNADLIPADLQSSLEVTRCSLATGNAHTEVHLAKERVE